MNTAQKGAKREIKTMRRLEDIGFTCQRSSGSHGLYDVIAWDGVSVRFVQVKSNAWPGKVEMEAIANNPVPPHCTKEIWRWDDHARKPRIKVLR